MNTATMTPHAVIRMAQRGYNGDEIDVVMRFGTAVEGGYVFLEKDARVIERDLKRCAETVRRLRGTRVVVGENAVVTTYRARPRKMRRLMRGVEERELAG